MLRTKRLLAVFASAGALLLAPLGASAMAATQQTGAPAATVTVFQIVNDRSGGCLQQNGTTDSLYVGQCSTNHSDLWLLNGFGTPCVTIGNGNGSLGASGCEPYEMVNYHSHGCVSETGSTAGNLYMNGCNTSGASAQEWSVSDPLDINTGSFQQFANAHSQLCMWQGNPGVSTVQQSACSADDSRDNWDVSPIRISS